MPICSEICGVYNFFLAISIVMISFLKQLSRKSLFYLGFVLLFAFLGGSLLYSFPQLPRFTLFINPPATTIIKGQVETLQAAANDPSVDESVVTWRNKFTKMPIYSIASSITRTLFAPYLWVLIQKGLNGKNYVELYYLGMPLWIICLFGAFWGGTVVLRKPNSIHFFLVILLVTFLSAYTIFFGEWSTRQRVFMVPIIFCYAAIGWSDLFRRWKLLSAYQKMLNLFLLRYTAK